MPEQPPQFICELCGEVHPTSEHKAPEEQELKEEWPNTDYVEDVPEAVAKGKEIFESAKELEEEDKPEEAIAALSEDKFAVAAYLAAQAQENSKGLIWVPIKIDAVVKKYEDDRKVVPRQAKKYGGRICSIFQGGPRWVGSQTPYAPWVQKMYAKDRHVHPGKEMANFTGDERLRDYINDLRQQIRLKKENQPRPH